MVVELLDCDANANNADVDKYATSFVSTEVDHASTAKLLLLMHSNECRTGCFQFRAKYRCLSVRSTTGRMPLFLRTDERQ